jgi:polysaccharide export outer membrane protein
MVYVMGEVNKPGGFFLNEKEGLSVLQALSLAGGTTRTASSKNARILRPEPASTSRTEIALDLKGILSAKAGDLELRPDDILFVPNSAAKSSAIRAIEAGIQISTGLIIWH